MARSQAPLFRSLAALYRAGIPWPQAVGSLAAGDPALEAVRQALDRGESLAEAFAPVVDPLDAALLEAGERGGSLEQVLTEMAVEHEAADHRRRERGVRTAYPVFLAHVASILLALPDLIAGRPLAALGWALLVLVPLYAWLLFQRRLDRRERPVPTDGEPPSPPPAFGPLRNRIEEADARGLEALGRLYDAGLPIGDALDHAIRAGWGGRVAVDLARAKERVARGEDLGGAWQALPPELARRLASAEESGSLGAGLQHLAEELRFDVETRRDRTAQILPVVLLLVLGAIVALRLFSFYGALYGRYASYGR